VSSGRARSLPRNLKLVLEYDGSAFYGFQKQPRHPTIQLALEKALSQLFNQKTKIGAASGRTDTGVHASHQVVHVKTASQLTLERIQKGLNYYLPHTVAVREVAEANPKFHARFSARSKVYEYRIWNHPVRSPLAVSRMAHVPYPLNIAKMRRAAAVLCGRHDFSSFCTENGTPRNKVKNVKRLIIQKRGHEIRIQIEADGFLYRMVRNMVGVLLAVGCGRKTPAEVRVMLRAKSRRCVGTAAEASGLSLIGVKY